MFELTLLPGVGGLRTQVWLKLRLGFFSPSWVRASPLKAPERPEECPQAAGLSHRAGGQTCLLEDAKHLLPRSQESHMCQHHPRSYGNPNMHRQNFSHSITCCFMFGH